VRSISLALASAVVAAALVSPVTASASCGWSVIDHTVTQDESGIWNPNVYRSVMVAAGVATLGGALWEGADSRLGKTMWQDVDGQIYSAVGVEAMKYAFTRARPSQTDDPCQWFQGSGHYSFPSGEAAYSAALVTPFILEYGSEYPAVYGLLLLPAYVGAGRIKNQAHWQSDVLFGWAVGGLAGWYAHSRETPLIVEVLPRGVFVGLKTRF
jgi:membrane-associated phospholipid phosphatase